MASPSGLPEATEYWSKRVIRNDNGKWTATRVWCVINVTNEQEALNQVPEAAINQPHPVKSTVKVSGQDVENLENGGPFAWIVTATYTIPDDGNDVTNDRSSQQDNLLNSPPEY